MLLEWLNLPVCHATTAGFVPRSGIRVIVGVTGGFKKSLKAGDQEVKLLQPKTYMAMHVLPS